MIGEYYKTKDSVDQYIELAEGYNGANLIIKLKNFLPLNAKLLEIGSGPGTDFEILNKSFIVLGSDFSTEFLKRLISKYPNEEFLELNATTIDTELKFDGIYSNKVLHHLKNDELMASIKRQYEILNPEGIVCHTFWKGEGTENYNGLFVNNHTTKEIKELFSDYFETLLIQDYEEMEKDDSILFIGKQRYKK